MIIDLKNRDTVFDALKVFLALGVLFAHCVAHFGPESVVALKKPIHYSAVFRVPAFYFISGFLLCNQLLKLYRKPVNYFKETVNIVSRKLHQLIIPAVLFSLLPSFSEGIDAILGFHTLFYFLPSLFTMILLYCLISLFIKEHSIKLQTLILGSYALLTTFLAYFIDGLPNYFTPLHWDTTLIGNIFFILGVLTAMHSKRLFPLIKKWWFFIFTFVLYTWLFTCIYKYGNVTESKIAFLLQEIIAPCFGIYAILSLFMIIFKYIEHIPIIKRISLYLSQRSLAMYVMQNFVFFILFTWIDVSQFSNGAYVSLWMAPLTVFGVLLIHDVVILIPGINKYLFGRNKPLISLWQVFNLKSAVSKE